MTVWKYELPLCRQMQNTGRTTPSFWAGEFGVAVDVRMPRFARPLHAGEQGGNLCVWAMVDPTREAVTRRFRVCGTGNPCPDDASRYVGTATVGPFVWHVFDEGER